MRRLRALAAGLILTGLALAGAVSASAGPAHIAGPRVTSITELAQLHTPLPALYDPSANAAAAVAAARARAKAHGKLLFIDLGGNWCGDCRILSGVMELSEVRRFVDAHYEVVVVDVGRFDHNLAIPTHYGLKKLQGVPAVLIVDPKTDRLLNPGHAEALADARSMTPQAISDWLAQWAR